MRAAKASVHGGLAAQVLGDYAMALLITLAVLLVCVGIGEPVLPLVAKQSLPLATWLFLVVSVRGVYEPWPLRPWSRAVLRTWLAVALGIPIAYMLFTAMQGSGELAGSFAATAGVTTVITRRVFVSHTGAGVSRNKVLIVGAGEGAGLVARALRNGSPSADIVGYFPSPNELIQVPDSEVLKPRGSLAQIALEMGVTEIIVAVSDRRRGSMPMRDLLECKIHGIPIWDITTYFEKAMGQIRLDFVNAGWLIFGEGFKQGTWRTLLKRISDIVASLILLAVFAPLMIITCVLIALESRGPVLFRQERVGLNGTTFQVLKFRSMRTDAEADGLPRWASTEDDRVTRVGRTIRKLRIDELPQLFNVLMGTMSLVGPRPERPFFVEQLTACIPYYAVRNSVKPGVTGWAQIRYHYGSTLEDAQEKLQYDLYYVKNHSLMFDLIILLETVVVVLTGKGAR